MEKSIRKSFYLKGLFKRIIASLCLVTIVIPINMQGLTKKAIAASPTLTTISKSFAIEVPSNTKKESCTSSFNNITGQTIYTYSYYVIPKGTKLAEVQIELNPARTSRVPGSVNYNGTVYSAYCDSFMYDVTVKPKNFKVDSYLSTNNKQSWTKCGTMTIYAGSELLTVTSDCFPKFGVKQTTAEIANNQKLMYGGGHIKEYVPRASSSGGTSYSISLGIPWSTSASVNINTAFCNVSALTNVFGTEQFKTKYDYKKWSGALHTCDKERQKVIFDQTTQKGGCTWYALDDNYSFGVTFYYECTLCAGSKSTITEVGTYSTSSRLVMGFHN